MFGRNQSIRRLTSPRRLRIESLEQRAMLAGDVMVELDESGDIFITGDGADNDVIIETTEPGAMSENYSIVGINGTNIVFDGKSAGQHIVSPESGRDVIIDAGGGDDVVNVRSVVVARALRVLMRNGDDQFTMTDTRVNGNFSIHGGAGLDDLRIKGVVDGGSNVSGGMGHDQIELSEFAPEGVVNVNGGEGNDAVAFRMLQSDTAEVSVAFSDGNDVLDSQFTIAESLTISGGLGDDEWRETQGIYHGPVSIDLGDGQDDVSLFTAEFRSDLIVQMGANTEDVVELIDVRESRVEGHSQFRGSMGDQTLSFLDCEFGRVDALFGGGDDTVGVTNSTISVFVARLGSGIDSIILNGSSFSRAVLVEMGGGRDEFVSAASTTFELPLTIDGGRGVDSATLGQTAIGGATINNFETIVLQPIPDKTA